MNTVFKIAFAICALLLYHTIDLLRSSNPFDRTLKKHYYISDQRALPCFGYGYSIHLSSDSVWYSKSSYRDLETAISELFYLHPTLPARTDNGIEISSSPDYRLGFDFNLLLYRDCFDLIYLHNFYPNPCFFDVVGRMSVLSVPATASHLYFMYDLRNLKKLYVKTEKPIEAFADRDNKGKPITVSQDFAVYVPDKYLNEYRCSESWNRLSFVTEEGNPVELKFEPITYM